MTDNVVYLSIVGGTTARHNPDDILEAAKGNEFDDVLIVGMEDDGGLWLSASTSDAERIVFLLERAKQKFMRIVEAT